MRGMLGFVLIFAVVNLLLVGVATGVGLLLHWLLPAVDLGLAILIALLAAGMSAYVFV